MYELVKLDTFNLASIYDPESQNLDELYVNASYIDVFFKLINLGSSQRR